MQSQELARTVYVGGLPAGTTNDDVCKLFDGCAAHAVVIRTFGFVTFGTAEAAAAATQAELCIRGRPVYAALSHAKYRSVAHEIPGTPSESRSAGHSSAVYVRVPSAMRHQPPAVVSRNLVSIIAAICDAPPRIHIPRKQGGGNQHRGFLFVQCPSAAEAAALLAHLQGGPWVAEMVRKKRRGGKNRGGRRRGTRHGRQPAGRAGGVDESERVDMYESDFESDDDEATEAAQVPRAASAELLAGPPASEAEADEDAEDDGCIEAMAQFVSESREWALSVQGFLVDHCRSFVHVHAEENRLEWTELHLQLRRMMETLLEQELAKLGVSIDDFVHRLHASPHSRAASDLVETVLAMDDFPTFARMMRHLKADLEGANVTQDALDQFASGSLRVA